MVALETAEYDKTKGNAATAKEYLAQTLNPSTLAALEGIKSVSIGTRMVQDQGGAERKEIATLQFDQGADKAAGYRAMIDLMVAAKANGVVDGELEGPPPGKDAKEEDLRKYVEDNLKFIEQMKSSGLIDGDIRDPGKATIQPGQIKEKGIKAATTEGEKDATALAGAPAGDKIPPVKGADALKLATALMDGKAKNDHDALKGLGLEIGEGRYVTGDAGKAIKSYMEGELRKNPQWQWGDADRLKISNFLHRDNDGPGKKPDGKSDFVKQLDPKAKDQHVDLGSLAKAVGTQLKAAGVIADNVDLSNASAADNLLQGIKVAQGQGQSEAQGR
ncbi:MAG: hypothetical protein MRY32_09310 [Rickettsiales bacterium]|nr:hypothetical protein [Rickettsiales bacterium]